MPVLLDLLRPQRRFLIDGCIAALGGTRTMSGAFLLLGAEAMTSVDVAEAFRERDEHFHADLRARRHRGIEAGTIRADVEPRDATVTVLGQLGGIGLQHQLDPRSRAHRAVPAGRRGAVAPGAGALRS